MTTLEHNAIRLAEMSVIRAREALDALLEVAFLDKIVVAQIGKTAKPLRVMKVQDGKLHFPNGVSRYWQQVELKLDREEMDQRQRVQEPLRDKLYQAANWRRLRTENQITDARLDAELERLR
jgi:hypothetical protein